MDEDQLVLGIDIGFSRRRRSTALVVIVLGDRAVQLSAARCTSDPEDLSATIAALTDNAPLAACAIDGPLRPGLRINANRRLCEQFFVLGAMGKRCRPGEVITPQGARLHEAATAAARLIAARVAPLSEPLPAGVLPLPQRALCEAFPSAFMALLLDDTALADLPTVPRGRKTDWLFRRLLSSAQLDRLLGLLLPRPAIARLSSALSELTDHDERAAALCAITALCLLLEFLASAQPMIRREK